MIEGRYRAHYLLNRAVDTGKIKRPESCEKCGGKSPDRNLDGHHRDYSKPLSVQWLCRACHMKAHYQRSTAKSNTVAFRIPLSLWESVKKNCATDGSTLRSFIEAALRKYLEGANA